MSTYVAFLRGIGPTNPNMYPKKLVGFFQKLGFKNVASVISSGNVVFDSASKSTSALESKIEKTLPKELGFKSMTIVWSKQELTDLIARKPFKNKTHSRESYLLVSFLKDRSLSPHGTIYTVLDVTKDPTPDFMVKLDKKYSKAITSRTWKTLERILKKMNEK